MIYIGSPYTSYDQSVMAERAEASMQYAADLFERGIIAISPLGVGGYMAPRMSKQLPPDWCYWDKLCLSLLAPCKEMHVLLLPSWQKSVGLLAEIEYCTLHKKPIKYVKL